MVTTPYIDVDPEGILICLRGEASLWHIVDPEQSSAGAGRSCSRAPSAACSAKLPKNVAARSGLVDSAKTLSAGPSPE